MNFKIDDNLEEMPEIKEKEGAASCLFLHFPVGRKTREQKKKQKRS